MFKHASIIPLIGGETIGSEQAYGTRPEYLLSYTPFQNHDQHIINWYDKEVPYYLIDKGENAPYKVDIIASVCPCAGLSQLSHGYGDSNRNNDWLITSAKYVLGELKPKVYWGENAPGLAGTIGTNIRESIRSIGEQNGYTMSLYRTKSLLHGLSQVRERAFYFFWKDTRTPLLNYYKKPYEKIEDTILNAKGNSQQEVINSKKPSADPYYIFTLNEIHNGISHAEFCKTVEPGNARNSDVLSYIERMGVSWDTLANWMRANGYEKEYHKNLERKKKLEAGGAIMKRGTIIPKEYIGAFVGQYPTMLMHPVYDRYITYREAMTIMGLPDSFELIDAKKNVNHICQNVPVQTARDMATEVMAYLDGKRQMINSNYTFQYNHRQMHETRNASSADLSSFMD